MNRKMAAFAGIGFELVGLMVFSVWAGGWLDTRFGLKGIGTVALIILATAGWFVHILRMLKSFEKDDNE